MFDINSFNVIQDDEYYYVFRSLEAGDISDIENGITDVMRTDRERYKRTPKYSEDSNLSLNEMFDHIKIHYRLDTNCISFTTNAGIAIMYGRDKDTYKDGNFNDQYKILRIPKNELGTISHFAPDYMISEISKLIAEYYEHADLIEQYQLDRIDNCITQEQLDSITKNSTDEDVFEGGITFNTNTNNYSTLSSKQNLEKNKLIAKIDFIPYNLVPNIPNKFLIQTLGSAFASMEVTHYKSIDNKYLIDCPNNIVDIFSILQQSNNPRVSEIENIIIDKLSKGELSNLEEFKYYNYELTEADLSIDNLYEASDNGKVDYDTMRNLYIKTFYLAKSKLRTYHSIKLLSEIIGDGYDDVLEELNNTYGIEPEITNKRSIDKVKLSDSIGLSYSTDAEKQVFNTLLNAYSVNDYEFLLDNKHDCISMVMLDILSDENNNINKEDYYANAIIDSFDWSIFNVKNIAVRHRLNLISKLKESNFMNIYEELLNNNYSCKDISRILLANIIKENENIDYNSTFTIEDLQDYLGYFKLKNSGIVLTRYQSDAVRNVREAHSKYQYTNVILPTGTGKSYVAITEMLEYLNAGKKVLYLAPDTEILNQIRYYLVSEVIGDSFGEDLETIVQKRYPNLILQTYAYLMTGTNSKDIINDKYDFIVTDELHRTGAPETKPILEELYKNQDKNCKILGITATPTRDCDGVDMAEYWARFFGYTEEEIYANKHLAYNMDYNQAIALGYLANPRVINCDYEFLTESEEMKNYLNYVENLNDEAEKQKYLSKLKTDIANSKGVTEILRENISSDDRCLVFCPIIDYDDTTGLRLSDEEKIQKYTKKLVEIYGNENIECYSMLSSYTNKKNQEQLDRFNADTSGKIKFMIVLNKMNEGKHGNYNKMIWFRALDSNSFVLCSQQLGRISKLIKRGKELSENERPLVIDLPNNLLRIQRDSQLKKSIAGDDISKFKLVVDWIKEYNKIPDINSNDYIESSMAAVLKVIIYRYHELVQDIDSIQNNKMKYRAKEIKRLSEELEFDIWDLRLPKRTIETKKRIVIPYYAKVNPIYRDYLDELDTFKKKTSFEARFEEILDFYEKHGELPNEGKYRDIRFKDGSALISKWIMFYKKDIIEYAKQGNEGAQLIVEKREWNYSKDEKTIKRIYELYDIVLKNGEVPRSNSKLRFSNGALIYSWLTKNENKKEVIELANSGDKKALYIIEKTGWNLERIQNNENMNKNKFTMSIEERVDELYDIVLKTGEVPRSNSKSRFSNGAVIYSWITNEHKKEIINLANNGNKKALYIIEKTGWNLETIQNYENMTKDKRWMRVEDRVDELYEVIINRKDITKCNFSDGKNMHDWIYSNNGSGRSNILRIKDSNNKAYEIAVALDFKIKKMNLSLEDRIEEIYTYFKKNNFRIFPSQQNDNLLFSDKTQMGSFLYRKKEKEKIIELAKNGNAKAMIICLNKFWLTTKEALNCIDLNYEIEDGIKLYDTFEFFKQVDELILFILQNEKTPQISPNNPSESSLFAWLSSNKKNIIQYATYEKKCMYVCLQTSWYVREDIKEYYDDTNFKITVNGEIKNLDLLDENIFEKKLKKIVEFYTSYGNLPIQKGTKPDESYLANFLSNNKKTIIKCADTNPYAMFICIRVGNGSNNLWIMKNKALKYYSEDYTFDNIKLFGEKSLSFEDRINEIFELLKNNKLKNSSTFSDGTLISYWKQTNLGQLLKSAKEGNAKAMFVCLDKRKGAKGFITEEEALQYYPSDYIIDGIRLFGGKIYTFEEFLDEVYNLYKTYNTNEIHSTRTPKFSSSITMSDWLISNKHTLLDMARNGNEKAKFIAIKKRWIQIENGNVISIKREIKSEDVFEKRIDCIIDYLIRYNRFPLRNDSLSEKYGFSLEQFLHTYKSSIINRASTNIKCMFICLTSGTIRNNYWINKEEALRLYPEDSCFEINYDGEIKKISLYGKTKDEKKIDEIYSMYVSTGILCNQNTKESFKDNSICIGTWIKTRRDFLIEQANLGNEHAKAIVEGSSWTKNYAPIIANVNLYALKLCLSRGWLLEKDVIDYPTYHDYKGKKK